MVKKCILHALAYVLFPTIAFAEMPSNYDLEARMKDSIGVRMINGEKFIQHKITKGETLYAINRRYNLPVEEIRRANPAKADKLVAGEILLIPVMPRKKPDPNETQEADKSIRKTETTQQEKPIGKSLPNEVLQQEKPQAEPIKKPEYLPKSASMTNRINANGEAAWMVKLTGKIEILTDPRVQQEPMYAIHKDIPEGTLIKISNPLNEKFIVVRSIKPNEEQALNPEVFLYISPVAGRYLDIRSNIDQMQLQFTLN